MQIKEFKNTFFREKLTLIFTLIFLLFIFSFGFGIIFFNFFSNFEFFGAKLSYFISGQATIFLSIFLIFIYKKRVSELERKYENTF